MTFDQPWWLAALPVVVAAVLFAGRGARGRAHRWATGLRAAAVALLVVALADPQVVAAGRDVDVAFLVDASDSVGAAGRRDARTWVEAALASRGEGDRAALALFGRDARLDFPLRRDPPTAEPAVQVDGSATDVARGLRLAQGALGSTNRRRVVLLTDGRPTTGELGATAEELAASGIRLDVVPLASAGVADVGVSGVEAPTRVRKGESYDVVVRLRNTSGGIAEGVLVLRADGEEVDRRRVEIGPGDAEESFRRTASAAGTVRFEAELLSGSSTVVNNDRGRAAVQVDGPSKVLVFERTAGLATDLTAALSSAGVPVDRRSAATEALPGFDQLLDYDGVVLVDVPAATLGAAGMVALDAFVRDAGRGVVAVGGEQSFGLGGYDGTPLEELLPVFAQVSDPKKRQSVAEALVVDTSGSMGACHCSDQDTMGGPAVEEGGVVKTTIAREAVAKAVAQLDGQDQLGVLAFNTAAEWVIPLQNLPPDSVVDDGLARLHPEGETDIVQAVREAIAGLRDAEARLRHIVLFSDGFVADPAGLIPVAEEVAEAGMTLTVVATGEGPPDLQRDLRRMALAGGGRFYAGRDLQSIPTIIALELRMAARPIVNEGSFYPTVTGSSVVTDGLDAAPPLHGYLATTAKPTAQTLLSIGEERDPLLATWRAGLGTSVAWLSDVAPRWSAEWVTWDRYARFWSDVVKSTFPGRDDDLAVEAVAGESGVEVAVTVPGTPPPGVRATALVTGPDGERTEVVLERAGPSSFRGTIPGAQREGVYAVTVKLDDDGQTVASATATATRAYPLEYALTSLDDDAVARAARATGGVVGLEPAAAFDPTGLVPGGSSRALWPWLTLVALMLAVSDVGVRRLRLERADLARIVAWVRARLRRRPPGDGPREPPRDAGTDALFEARARARAAREMGTGAPE